VDLDNAQKGKCCSRIKYLKYPEITCYGKKCKQEEMVKKSLEELNNMPQLATHCLEFYVYEELCWKICHREEDRIIKLKQVVVFGVLRTKIAIPQDQLMGNFIKFYIFFIIIAQFLRNADTEPLQAPEYWDWHDQTRWDGYCDTDFMQSPIDISFPNPPIKGFYSNFNDDVPIGIRYNGPETVVDFLKDAGYIKIEYSNRRELLFTFKIMSFRFPAEHLINGFRFDGEIILKAKEIVDGGNEVQI